VTILVANEVYGEYVAAGEEGGVRLATRVSLGRALQVLGVAEMLPPGRTFDIQRPDYTVHVQMVQQDGQWYFHAWHTEYRRPRFLGVPVGPPMAVTVVDIPVGAVPAYHTPGAPPAPADVRSHADRLRRVLVPAGQASIKPSAL
jgi:hypothetical protein